MPKWTTDQLKAIQEEGCNILVSAGAGSGKTAVLSERVLRKISEGISINNILVCLSAIRLYANFRISNRDSCILNLDGYF